MRRDTMETPLETIAGEAKTVTAVTNSACVELRYARSGSFVDVEHLQVSLNGIFVDKRDVAEYLWQQFQRSPERGDMSGEELEFAGEITRHDGRDTCFFVRFSNGVRSSRRLRVSSDGVAAVGEGAGYRVAFGSEKEVQQIADDLAEELSKYVIDNGQHC